MKGSTFYKVLTLGLAMFLIVTLVGLAEAKKYPSREIELMIPWAWGVPLIPFSEPF